MSSRTGLPTSRDVAREAGVSQSTVSYVLTGRRSISPETRQRVLDAMERLSFQPNAGARALAGRRIHVLGAMLPFRAGQDLAASMELIGALATAARHYDHDILLAGADEGPQGLSRLYGTGICDGLFVLEVEEDDPRLDVVRAEKVPAVVVGAPRDAHDLVCVDLDFEAAGAIAVDELHLLGHDVVLLATPPIDGPEHVPGFMRRFARGARERGHELAVHVEPLPLDGTHDEMVRRTRHVVESVPDATGIVMLHDVQRVVAALEDSGLAPGTRTAVVALCRDEQAERERVPLTSIPLEPRAVADVAVKLLIERLDRGEWTPVRRLVRPRLVRRASSIPPPA